VVTGIEQFDTDTGGLKPGNFIVIAGETSGGKSSLLLNWVNAALLAGVGVALFSLEMDREEICDFLVALNCEVNRNSFNTGQFDPIDIPKIANGIGKLQHLPLWIFDEAIQTAESIDVAVTQLCAENKIGLVGVDYIQLVAPFNPQDNREQQVAGISQDLRATAKKNKVPMMVLSQLNEDGKLRESRVIAHNANIMIMIDKLEEKAGAKMRVVKGRRIQKKNYGLKFTAQFGRIIGTPKITEEDVPQPSRSNPKHTTSHPASNDD
jgi:replicative DNA helicase